MRSVGFRSRASLITEVRGLLASFLLVALVYGRALGFGFARVEEAQLAEAVGVVDLAGIWNGIFMNLARVGDGDGGLSGLWRPSVNVAYLLAGWIGQGDAWAFRLLALASLVVLGWSSRKMLGRSRGRDLVLMLVVLHPMMSAAVLDVLALPSLLMAVCAVLAVTTTGRAPVFWTMAAMGAHEAAAIIPFIAMGFRVDAKGERRGDERWTRPALGVLAWWLLLFVLETAGVIGRDAISIPTLEGVSHSAAQVWFYAGRLLLPIAPVFARSAPEFLSPWTGLAWVGLLTVLWVSLRSKKPRIEPVGPGFAAGLCCVLLALLAAGGLVSVVPGYGEGRLALPIVGLAWMLASRHTSRVASWTLVPLFFVLTLSRVGVWKDPIGLWAESHRALPGDAMVSLEYGQRLIATNPTMAVGLMGQVLSATGPSTSDAQRYKAHIGAIQAWFEIGNDKRALPHLAAIADPDSEQGDWLLVRRCVLETRFGVDEASYTPGTVLSPIARVCTEAARRFPRHARLANAAGVEAAIRGDAERARYFLQRAVELAPHNADYRRSFSLIPMNVMGWSSDEPLSPDPAAAP